MPGKRGRPAKWYTAPDGTEHHGLIRRTDGRWLIKATGRYLHRDMPPERAVKTYLEVMAGNPIPPKPKRYSQTEVNAVVAAKIAAALADERMVKLGSKEFWEAVRSELIMTPWRVEQQTGIGGIEECVRAWIYKGT